MDKPTQAFKPKKRKRRTKSYVGALVQILESIDFDEAQKAAQALGDAADPSTIEPLVSLLRRSSSVRCAAIAALKKIGAVNETAATELAMALMRETQEEAATGAGPGEVMQADRRRSPRVLLEIPVVVVWRGENQQCCTEVSTAEVVNAYGAMLTLKNPVSVDVVLELTNQTTQATAKARVVWVGDPCPEGGIPVGIELGDADPDFWHGDIPQR